MGVLPAIPESAEGAMLRAMSSGEEGRRGQQAYASFLESSGGSLNLVRDCIKVSYNADRTFYAEFDHSHMWCSCHRLTAQH